MMVHEYGEPLGGGRAPLPNLSPVVARAKPALGPGGARVRLAFKVTLLTGWLWEDSGGPRETRS